MRARSLPSSTSTPTGLSQAQQGRTSSTMSLRHRLAQPARFSAFVTAFVLSVGMSGWSSASPGAETVGPLQPLPMTVQHNRDKAALGERMFMDKRLSRNNQVACVTCHDLNRGGADGRQFALGIDQRRGAINTPTVFNSALNFRQFWDGRARNLNEQIDGPIHDPKEMDSNWPDILRKLNADPGLTSAFRKIYPDGISQANVKDVLVHYQNTLITPNSRFDRWLKGEKDALTANEQKGYQLFISYGCVACHQGVNVGGNMFQTFGVLGDYFGKRGNITQADMGRYNITKKESDRHSFKVPSLRNVALTAPYFHDGSAKTLDEAVNVMFTYQIGRKASAEEKTLIVQFLHTLTGEHQGKPLDQLSAPSALSKR